MNDTWANRHRKELIRLVFSLDDPSATSNQEIETRILESLARHGLRATFAVILFRATTDGLVPLTRERARKMREAITQGVLDVTLNGNHHINARPDGHPNEFVGVSADRQVEMIAAGKALLESVFEKPVMGFVPPWNSFDAATLDGLETMGFSHLSSSLRHVPVRPTRMRLLPLTCHLPTLEGAILEARRFARLAPVVSVVMHHYDFPGGDKPVYRGYDGFDSLLARVAAQADVRVKTLSELAGELTPAASQPCFGHLRLRARLPWRFRHWLPDLCVGTRPLVSAFSPVSLPDEQNAITTHVLEPK